MPDDIREPLPADEKLTLTPREETKPTPVCTIMSDGSIKVTANITVSDLHRVIQQADGVLVDRAIQRGMATEQLLFNLRQRYNGFDEETERVFEQFFQGRA